MISCGNSSQSGLQNSLQGDSNFKVQARCMSTGLMHLWRCLQALSGGLPSKGQGHPLGTRRVDERVSASVVLLWWPSGFWKQRGLIWFHGTHNCLPSLNAFLPRQQGLRVVFWQKNYEVRPGRFSLVGGTESAGVKFLQARGRSVQGAGADSQSRIKPPPCLQCNT